MAIIYAYKYNIPDTDEQQTQFIFDVPDIDTVKQILDSQNIYYTQIYEISVNDNDVPYIQQFFDIWLETIFNIDTMQFYPPEQQLQKLQSKAIDILNKYTYDKLSPTDWVIIKLSEQYVLYGGDSTEYQLLLSKYANIINYRSRIRNKSNEISDYIQNVTDWKPLVYIYYNLSTIFESDLPINEFMNIVMSGNNS